MAEGVARHPRFIDLTGQRFGLLLVVRYAGKVKSRKSLWECLCDCGGTCVAVGYDVRIGKQGSCGCVKKHFSATHWKTHGLSHTREFRCWHHMVQRCTNPNNEHYHVYGGRGITVCENWLKSFESFYSDMGPAPSPKHSLDRYPDNNGNYEPGNVRWATSRQQARNKRTNRLLTYQGRTMTIVDWAAELGLHQDTLRYRLKKGLSVEEALSRPAMCGRPLL